MQKLISFISPQRWWDWPFGVLVWGFVASCLAYVVEFLIEGGADDPFGRHVTMTTLIAAPLILLGMALVQHLDRLQKEMAITASTDPLTGLFNRRAFLSMAEQADPGVLLMMDLDFFKRVNDSYGHTVGDDVLVQAACVLRTTVRERDLLGRLGGEEFAVFLIGADAQAGKHVGDRLAQGLVYDKDGLRFTVTASVGGVTVMQRGQIAAALRDADKALYQAKRAGRAQFAMHHPEPAVRSGVA